MNFAKNHWRSGLRQCGRLCVCFSAIFPLIGFFLISATSEAQYKCDHIPGFLGLQSGTQAPPGFYVGNLVWVYPTSTVVGNNGRDINLPGSLTSTAYIILLDLVTNHKFLGGNIGVSGAFPFIKNRIQLDSLDVSTPFAYTDMFVSASLGWSLKRADVIAGYNLYIPTGRFSLGATNNTGLGIWGNEVYAGTTVYMDKNEDVECGGNFLGGVSHRQKWHKH
jgi:hypothetical protein